MKKEVDGLALLVSGAGITFTFCTQGDGPMDMDIVVAVCFLGRNYCLVWLDLY